MPLPADYVRIGSYTTLRGRKRVQSFIRHQSWVNPATLDADGYVVSGLGPAAAGTYPKAITGALAVSGVGLPDYPRCARTVVTHGSSIVAMTVRIKGYDINGEYQEEDLVVSATGTNKTIDGTVPFSRVTGVDYIVAADASGNTVTVGTCDRLGLDASCVHPAPIAEQQDGSVPGTAGAVVVDSTSVRLGYYDPNAALNGALDFDLWYLVGDPAKD